MRVWMTQTRANECYRDITSIESRTFLVTLPLIGSDVATACVL